jgi:hypothetical protein
MMDIAMGQAVIDIFEFEQAQNDLLPKVCQLQFFLCSVGCTEEMH